MRRDAIRTSARLAGAVRRYHTWPVLNPQTVADHTWNVMRIYWVLFGPLPAHVSTYIMWHDVGELCTGDLPFPVKAENPDLKHIMDRLEAEACQAMGGPAAVEVAEDVRVRVKLCELIEMHEFGLVEYNQGNQFALPIVRDTARLIKGLVATIPHTSEKVAVYLRQLFGGDGCTY